VVGEPGRCAPRGRRGNTGSEGPGDVVWFRLDGKEYGDGWQVVVATGATSEADGYPEAKRPDRKGRDAGGRDTEEGPDLAAKSTVRLESRSTLVLILPQSRSAPV
jgi:hypothetical protein